jgi:hypothetical protein
MPHAAFVFNRQEASNAPSEDVMRKMQQQLRTDVISIVQAALTAAAPAAAVAQCC